MALSSGRAPLNRHQILGIDASTHSLAFCLMVDGAPQKWGEIEYIKSDNLFVRLGSIESRSAIVVDMFRDVDFVMIEAPVVMRNIRVATSLAYSYGIPAGKFAARGITVADVPPVAWQKFIGNPAFSKIEKKNLRLDNPGKSRTWYPNKERAVRKQRTKDIVEKEFGIVVESDNVSDAIGVAMYATRGKHGK